MKPLLATLMLSVGVLSAADQPSYGAGPARANIAEDGTVTLKNNVLAMSWRASENGFSPLSISSKLGEEALDQRGRQLFRLATGKARATGRPDHVYLGMRILPDAIEVVASYDNASWVKIQRHPREPGKSSVPRLRLGKMDKAGGGQDYPDRGDTGECAIEEVEAKSADGTILDLGLRNAAEGERTWSRHLSDSDGTALDVREGRIEIATGANCATYVERALPDGTGFVSCKVTKSSDQGESWGPGLALVWDDGDFVVCGVRDAIRLNIHTKDGESIRSTPSSDLPNYDLPASRFTVVGRPKIRDISPAGKEVRVLLRCQEAGVDAVWRGILKEDAHYIRQQLVFRGPPEALSIHGMELLDVSLGEASQVGKVPGSPVASQSLFAGVELPVTSNAILEDSVRAGFPCKLTLTRERPYSFSTVVGTFPGGQLRRAFLAYLEKERARPSTPFLHYNCWYDLGMNCTAKGIAEVAKAFQEKLSDPFGLTIDSYVVDDGWDDYSQGLWAINQDKFPGGFGSLTGQLAKRNSHLGIWISPLGGYSGQAERTQHAKNMGLITGDALDLSEPGYYQWYLDTCRALMKEHGVNYFKWDKAGSGVSPHFMALLDLAQELRKVDPHVFINVTVGTWPSPFWLNHVDCTWRSGADVGWMGKGDNREKWITFRDAECYARVVKAGPLYPLNSIMHHGVVHGRAFQGTKVSEAGSDLKNEVRSYFGAGPTLQELYLTPSMMTDKAWKDVGEAAKWAHENADVLVDTHWVGGDPAKLEPYGYASWSPKKGTLMLRNPDDRSRVMEIDIAAAFELPEAAPSRYRLENAYADQASEPRVLARGEPVAFELNPFEVLVFDAYPQEAASRAE